MNVNILKQIRALLAAFWLITMTGVGAMAGIKQGIYSEKLDNGVTVIISETKGWPVAACNFWIRAGAATEGPDEKGLSHFLEHMMFKGTPSRAVGVIDREIKQLGGYNNAFTSYDATNYVIVLPGEHVKKALEIQFDALVNSSFDPGETTKELEVVITELYRGLDNPNVFLWQKLMNLVFENYYKDPIIGFVENLRGYDREDVAAYHSKFYIPSNMTVVITGGVNKDELMPFIRETFGSLENKTTGKLDVSLPAFGERKLKFASYKGAVNSRYFAMAFPIPDALSPETPAIEILGRVLGGTDSSPLYRKLKEELELVDDIDSDIFSGRHGGVFIIFAQIREGKFEETVGAITEEINRIKAVGVRQPEVDRIKADIIREQEKEKMKAENEALSLGYYASMRTWEDYFTYIDRLKRVLDSDVNESLGKYIDFDAASAVIYYPENEAAQFSRYKTAGDFAKLISRPPSAFAEDEGVVKSAVLNNGITLIHKRLTNTSLVAARIAFRGGLLYEGSAYSGAYRGITNLMTDVMEKGTRKRNAEEIAREFDSIGSVFAKGVSRDSFGWSAEVVNNNFERFMELASDIILNPSFEIAEIKKEKKQIINSIKRLKDSPASYAFKIFDEEFFEWHPYGYFYAGTEESVNNIPSRILKEWHDRNIIGENMIFSIAGNISFEEASGLLEKYFKGIKRGRAANINLPVKITQAKKERREIIDKNQSHTVIGFLGPKATAGDFFAFRVLDTILSGGMDSRLFKELREKRNLCYSVYSTFDRLAENGAFRIYTATSPENEGKAAEVIFELLKELLEKGISEDELKSAKAYINGMYTIGRQDYSAQASSYVTYELTGLGWEEVENFIKNINAVTRKDVMAAAEKYIRPGRHTMVVVGPEKKEKK